MKVNDIIHGFRVVSAEELTDINAVMWRMEYLKNGADLIWLDREDEGGNKVFGIGFKTVPEDSTGVFHIIEHSVLCGSRKYPSKEPFVELIKSSLNTFLNAMTYPDKTVYPIASRNDRDFLNLTDVYLDAVFHPLSIESPLAFRQEGWHYEPSESDGTFICNGVVYNEMKGAYASPDTVLAESLDMRLFPDNCYGFSSGGDPVHIPELTYGQYKASHARFYSASNSRIFLDGKIPFEETFSKLDSYLSEFDRIDVNADIELQKPVCPADYFGEYAVGEEEDTENKALITEGYVFADYSEVEKIVAAEVLADVLAGSNESPICKAVLEKDLAEDISVGIETGILQAYARITVRNADENLRDEIHDTVFGVIKDQIEKGVDIKELEATLNSFEFSSREKDFGSTPRGLVYGLSLYDSWLYGGDPALYLRENRIFKAVRSHIGDGSGYFENLLKEIFIDCPHKAAVCLVPSRELTRKTCEEEAARVAAAVASWTESEKQAVLDNLSELRAFQNTPDSPEKLAAIPRLHLSDITDSVPPSHFGVSEVCGRTLLTHSQKSNGIIYGSLFFNLSDFSDSDLHMAAVISGIIGELETSKHSALEIMNITRSNLGAFGTDISVNPIAGKPSEVAVSFNVSFSVLESNAMKVRDIVGEILNDTLYSAGDEISDLIRQTVIGTERSVTGSGNRYGARLASASSVLYQAVDETVHGISQLRFIQKLVEQFDSEGTDAFCTALADVARRIFVRERIVISLTGNTPDGFAADLINCIPSDPASIGAPVERKLYPKINTGIIIPADTSFASKGGNFRDYGYSFSGALSVADQFITYDYLWLQVRVNGGAYGTGLGFARSGRTAFTSYRDPQPANSLKVYDGAGDHIRQAVKSGEDFEKYIISALSGAEPLLTPRTESARDDTLWICGEAPDTPSRLRAEILATTKEQLLTAADILDKVCASAAVCVVGSEEKIRSCGDIIEKTEPLKC